MASVLLLSLRFMTGAFNKFTPYIWMSAGSFEYTFISLLLIEQTSSNLRARTHIHTSFLSDKDNARAICILTVDKQHEELYAHWHNEER